MTRADTVIRKAQARDAAALARLAEGTFRTAFGEANTRANMDAFCAGAFGEAIQAREIADPGLETIVVESGGELVAYAQLRRDRTPSCVTGAQPVEIQRFYVDPRWHGTGLAQELMSWLLADARASGAQTVWLGVWEHNPRAIAFYRRRGFREVGDQMFRLGDDDQRDLVMELSLSEPPPAVTGVDRVPLAVWAMALGVALLRALPFLQQLVAQPPPGFASLPIGYIPKDWLAYVALVRQPADTGRLLLANPFTTEPQEGRFVLLFHQALGALHATTGIDPFWLLELSRVPLLLVFFAVLWRFLGHLFAERRVKVWACALAAFAGGVEAFALPLAHAALPMEAAGRMERDLRHLYGWNGFASSYNPLWIAALALLLVVLRPLLQPGGPASARDRVQGAVGFLLLALVHSYSAILVGAILAGVGLVELALDPPALRRRLAGIVVTLAPPAAVLVGLTLWQLRDPVFRASAGGVLGPQAASLFWAPVAYGALAFFALRGFARLASEGHPWRLALGGWLGGVALLASSTVLNGYHFVFGLHLPLCLAAAPALASAVERWRGERPAGAVRLAVAIALLFVSPLYVTLRSLREARAESVVPAAFLPALADLREVPPTNVLAPPQLGNLIPAMTPHRVWLGQWFMTPGFRERSRWYGLLVADPPAQAGVLRGLVEEHRIGAVVVPARAAPQVAALLAPRVGRVSTHGEVVTLFLRPAAAAATGAR